MTKKFVLIVAVALAGIIGVSVGVYNHFKLWQFKGIFGEYAKNYFENPKCDFNPRVNPNGGGRILIRAFISSLTLEAESWQMNQKAKFLPTQIPKKPYCKA